MSCPAPRGDCPCPEAGTGTAVAVPPPRHATGPCCHLATRSKARSGGVGVVSASPDPPPRACQLPVSLHRGRGEAMGQDPHAGTSTQPCLGAHRASLALLPS